MKKKIIITPIGPKLVKKKLIKYFNNDYQYNFVGGITNDQNKIYKFLKNSNIAIIGSEVIKNDTLNKLSSLNAVIRFGGGLPNLDINLAKQLGIKLYQIKTNRVSEDVSLLLLTKILSFIFNIHIHNDNSKKGNWQRIPSYNIENFPVGLIGAGKIAHSIVPKLKFLGFKIGYWSRSKKNSLEKLGAKRTLQIEELIKKYKIICLVISNNDQTRHLINKKILSKMKESILINVSRGEIVNEKEIMLALKSGKLKKYITDVTEYEPPIKNSFNLLKLRDVVSTPHIGGYSESNLIETSKIALKLAHQNI